MLPLGCRDRADTSGSGAASDTTRRDRPTSENPTDETDPGDQRPARRPDSFAPAVERVRPAVVNLYSARRGDESAGADEERGGLGSLVPNRRIVESLGSGVVIDAEGHVVTNHHVIEHADQIRARLLDERWFETRLVGTDPKSDIALLRLVDAEDLPVAPLGSVDDLRVGDWVVAIGNPLGLTSTVTAGIASGIGRSNLPLGEQLRYQDFIQTDASINPGNSGGPLVDAEGRVVGINTAISAEAQGIGFAIPISMVRKVVPKLQKRGRADRSWIGLYVDAVPPPLRRQIDVGTDGGVLVTGVVEGGPAERAGLRKGDVLLELDGETIDDVDHVSWLAGNLEVGAAVECRLQRGSERKTVQMTPTPPPSSD